MTNRFITINRVAGILSIHHQTARHWLESLNIPTVTLGMRHVYRSTDVLPRIEMLLGNL